MEMEKPSTRTNEARETLDRFGSMSVVVIGESMYPAIRKGESVVVERKKMLRGGDAALIDTPDGLLIHRIAGGFHMGGKEWFVHAGDNSGIPGIAGGDQIIGVARCPASIRPLAVKTSVYILLLKGCCGIADLAGCSTNLFSRNFKILAHTLLKRLTVGARVLSV